ncbi:hypothetical protein [Rhizobacter sp. SG703]|uniref:hypothetical protein n=1 Tax=Rhizobacter sp. SG703 TaxID=2587140 RepID=UPI0014475E68|nr:hypothetical protein [Rhizobacter sp. SG703]NKI97035.1 hypothetical protein [Rhizobacter sp. SG703]
MPALTDSFSPSQFSPSQLPPAPDALRQRPLIADLLALSGFRTLMAREGTPVNIARMMFDRPYAYERIAVAHGSADAALQRAALQLFGLYLASDPDIH